MKNLFISTREEQKKQRSENTPLNPLNYQLFIHKDEANPFELLVMAATKDGKIKKEKWTLMRRCDKWALITFTNTVIYFNT